ncbi:MAG: hypothetical protein ACJ75B_03015 [Flavisolibacter sp.]
MKARKSLLGCFLFMIPQFFFAQDNLPTGSASTQFNPFAKGNWEFPLMRNFHYNYLNDYNNEGDKTGHENSLGFNLGATYFVSNGFGIGLDLSAKWQGDHTSYDILDRSWMGKINFTYGKNFPNNFNLYTKLDIGYGMQKTIDELPTGSTTQKDNQTLFGLSVGSPIQLCNRRAFLTPHIGYDYRITDYDGGNEKEGEFRFGLRLNTYLDDDDFMCDCHHGFQLSHGIYNAGNSYLDFCNEGSYMISHSKVTEDATSGTSQLDYSGALFRVGYNYYPINNFAIGLGFGIRSQVEKPENMDEKFTDSRWDLGPNLVYNLPFGKGWNNLYTEVGARFGSQTQESSGGGSSSSQKINTTNYNFGIGYNDFFAKQMAFTWKLGYRWDINKDSQTDQEQKSHGLEFSAGIRAFLPSKK